MHLSKHEKLFNSLSLEALQNNAFDQIKLSFLIKIGCRIFSRLHIGWILTEFKENFHNYWNGKVMNQQKIHVLRSKLFVEGLSYSHFLNYKTHLITFERCELRPFFASHARTFHVQIKICTHTCVHSYSLVVALHTRTRTFVNTIIWYDPFTYCIFSFTW
jgi:hypothetical protein